MYRPYPNGAQQPHFPAQSWYPPLQPGMDVAPSGASPMSVTSSQNHGPGPYPPQQNTMTSASDAVLTLKNKSMDELQRLLSDQDAYTSFLQSADSTGQINSLWSDLLKSNVDLAKHNLEKESEIFQLRNQCNIIRTTELAAAQEKFNEVQSHGRDMESIYAPAVLLERLQDAASKADDESEIIYQQLLSEEITVGEFLQSYRKKRYLYHKQVLTRLAAKTSMASPG